MTVPVGMLIPPRLRELGIQGVVAWAKQGGTNLVSDRQRR